MRVIVTRPGPQAGKWVNALRGAGLDALALPLIEIAGPPDPQAVRAAWQRLNTFNALMFVSANAVEQFFGLQPGEASVAADADTDADADAGAGSGAGSGSGSGADALAPDAFAGPRFFVTGPGSVAALVHAGVPGERIDAPDAAAAQFDSEALWQVVKSQVQPDWRVLIVRGNADGDAADEAAPSKGSGRNWLAARLTEKGAAVEFLVAYERRAPVLSANALALVQAASSDGTVWLFSSSEAVHNLQAIACGQSWSQARVVATHPRIAQAARAAGFGVVAESRPAVPDLLASIESLA